MHVWIGDVPGGMPGGGVASACGCGGCRVGVGVGGGRWWRVGRGGVGMRAHHEHSLTHPRTG